MPKIDVIVGCQFGSEAKGLVAGMVVKRKNYDWIVSVNSSQAGHTTPFIHRNGDVIQVVTRQLPAACVVDHNALIYIGPGAVINPEVLFEEINNLENLGISISNRLYINKYATIITGLDIEMEKSIKLREHIGSTCEGVGNAISRRVMRTGTIVKEMMNDFRKKAIIVDDLRNYGGNILLEGSQGFGLSVFSRYYPFCTSRDTTTMSFLAYAGLSFRDVCDVYGVYRTYPIRVGGNSGPLYEEITWDIIANHSGYMKLGEKTTVTKRLRRIGCWDAMLAHRATKVNGVNKPILTFANYLNKNIEGINNLNELKNYTSEYNIISNMSNDIGIPWYAISTDSTFGWIIND